MSVGFPVMGERDLDAIVALESRAFPDPWTRQQFIEELTNPRSTIQLIQLDGLVRGYLCYWSVVDEVQILNVAVDPVVRRRGLARQLLGRVLSDTPTARLLMLEVRRSNVAAIGLYESAGFRPVTVRRAYYPDGEDAIIMHLERTL